MHLERAGPLLTAHWTGWGTGNFISAALIFGLPLMVLVGVPAVLIERGIPPAPDSSKLPILLGALALAVWNIAALIANRYNRVQVTASSLVIVQGYVPWPVSFRRKTLPLREIEGFDIESDWDPQSEATDYRVLVRRGAKRTRVTGAVSKEKAHELAEALGAAVGVPVGTC